jgi:L-aminopeptidase/D-esterase-like protein
MMPFALSDAQLHLVMAAAQLLPFEKRAVVLERVAGHLQLIAARHFSDAEVERAIRAALSGLVQGTVA